METKYEFRKRLLEVHPADIGHAETEQRSGMCLVTEDWEIVAPKAPSRLMRYAAHDLRDFFETSLGMSLRVRFGDGCTADNRIVLCCDPLLESDKPLAFRVSITANRITVVGKTERGAAQGFYLLEDMMREQKAPYLPHTERLVEPAFSPRMTHSGYMLDVFPDEYLKAIAHAGMDAIIVYVSDLYKMHCGFPDPDALWKGTGQGFCDFNELIYRAEGFGLDVYVYSHYKLDMHPEDECAREYYEARFGRLFGEFPKLKGIIFVGETFEFPSRDPHTIGKRCQLRTPEDRGDSVGWYPCSDYPVLVKLVKDIIRAKNPDADIVFWSYNWGSKPADIRLELIRNLPRDISLLVTFDMFETFHSEEGVDYRIADYSISFEGPGYYFITEAEEAKKLGIRLYAMANTGGRTWDIGDVPYLPFPQQWAKRCERLIEAHDKYGLCGLMESHHFGWTPSFVSDMIKYAYMNRADNLDAEIERLAQRDFGDRYADAIAAWRCFSEAIRQIVASAVDQYGPFRIGPTYPLVFDQTDVKLPSVPYGQHSGNAITFPMYSQDPLADPGTALLQLHRTKRALELFEKGNALLKNTLGLPEGTALDYARRHYALCRFIENTYRTTVNVKRWNIMKRLLLALDSGAAEKYGALWDEISPDVPVRTAPALVTAMEKIAAAENANAADTVQFCETDSLIGYEPTMEYMCSRSHIEWKIGTVNESVARLKARYR